MALEPNSPAAVPNHPPLGSLERRILGVMVEKAKTTPDAYPMSLNSMVTGCNQKSNRDPVMNLTDQQVEEALSGLQAGGLAIRITGGRVERWRHTLYETWKVDKVELAVLAELLLRGAQTEGELRGRASRMEPIDNLDALRAVLKRLAERRLVVYLTPEGRRGTTVTHGFHATTELERLRTHHEAIAGQAEAAETAQTPVAPLPSTELQSLREQLADLQTRLGSLEADMRAVKEGLGM